MSRPAGLRLRANQRFVLRTPLLPFDALLEWSHGVTGSLAEQRAELRARLRRALERPELREALFLASPKLLDSLPQWERDPDSRGGQQLERALVRYFQRMAGRATPFGLFAGISVGRLDGHTSLALAARREYGRSTRLDNDYLFALAEALRRDPQLRAKLRWRPNSSIHALGGRLRYAEARLDGKQRSHHLVAVETNEFIEAILARARDGATIDELAQTIVEADPEIALDEAREFIHELIDNQLLESELAPTMTGREPLEHMIEVLRAAGAASEASEPLARAASALAALDERGVGCSPESYLEIATGLRALPGEPDLARLFQVDLVKPGAELALDRKVVAELERGLGVLHRLERARTDGAMARFAREFESRYEGREVPLLEALDEESGLGFETAGTPVAVAGPLLRGLRFPPGPERHQARFGPWEGLLLQELQGVWARGERDLVLRDELLEPVVGEHRVPHPDALSVQIAIAACSPEAMAAGELEVVLSSLGGPSGAELLGRFCHASPELRAMVDEQLRAEEALRPEAVFAEVVHLSQGRVGNILCRPVLRAHEIPYLGVSTAPESARLPVQDLMVSIRNGRVVLRSQRLDREVVPRMTTAHNFSTLQNIGVYRFLCGLQDQDIPMLGLDFGPLRAAPFLPRLRYGKLVISRARWRLDARELAELTRAVRGAAGEGPAETSARRSAVIEAMAGLRSRLGLPRWVVLADGDNELPIDLDNPLSIEAAAWPMTRGKQAILRELYPEPERMLVRGPEGRYLHEMIVCFTREGAARVARKPVPIGPVRRRFTVGSPWLYAKIYTGLSSIDTILREVVAPVRAQALASGAATQWFFLRFRDEADHLRVRFGGDPRRLTEEVLPALTRALEPWLEDGLVWRFVLDTYEREVERYGGPEGIELAEQIFFADSEAVLSIVEGLVGDAGADARWRLAACGIDRLLGDLGMSLEERRALVTSTRDGFREEFFADVPLFKQIGAHYREQRVALAGLLEHGAQGAASLGLAHGVAQLDRRSAALRSVTSELARRARAGGLVRSLPEIAGALVHMHVNRLLHAGQRAQELVLHDLLSRHYASLASRRPA